MRKALILVVALCVGTVPAFTADDVQAGLRAELMRKQVMLREPAVGKKLEFDREGKPVGERAPGSVAVGSVYEVVNVELKGNFLLLRARRVVLVNPAAESMVTRDVTEIWLELADASSVEAVRAGLRRVFVDAKELEARKKKLWRAASEEEKAQGISGYLEGKPVAGTVAQGMTPPKAITMPNPTDPVSAVVLSVVIDERGIPAYIEVLRPPRKASAGKAVEAMSQWRFQPATRDGKPVAIMLEVEMRYGEIPRL